MKPIKMVCLCIIAAPSTMSVSSSANTGHQFEEVGLLADEPAAGAPVVPQPEEAPGMCGCLTIRYYKPVRALTSGFL